VEKKIEWQALAFAAASGAMIFTLIGFLALGWTPGSVAAKQAQKAADNAVIAALGAVCKAQFSASPDLEKDEKTMKTLSTYAQASYLETGGWATMPGDEAPKKNVAKACAAAIGIPSVKFGA
jgi:hypothetical protein